MKSLKKILITGASGMCGQYILDYFQAKEEYEVYPVSRRRLNHPNHIQHDLTQPIIEDKFPLNVDVIIHTAAKPSKFWSFADHEENQDYNMIDNNLQITFNLVQYARKSNPSTFINFSSISVYGFDKEIIPDEETVPKPESTYGLSKLLSEITCQKRLNLSTRLINLRLAYILVPIQPESYFISRIASQLYSGDPISLVNPDHTKFSFIDISDILNIIDRILNTHVSGNYNVVNDDYPTVRDVFSEIKKHIPISESFVEESLNESDIFDLHYDNQKVKKDLNLLEFISFKKSIENILSQKSKT